MTTIGTTHATTLWADLKAKERERRSAWPQAFALRAHRAVSWLGRADREPDDPDTAFILLWIALNAAYADLDAEDLGERGRFAQYAGGLVRLDGEARIYDAIWSRFSQEVRLIFDNRYVFRPFWDHHNSGGVLAEDWRVLLYEERAKVHRALAEKDTVRTLAFLFGRLYVLRNQLIHGGSTWNSAANRAQVGDGRKILAWLLPIFLDIMMDHPDQDWGRPSYPVVD